VVKLSGLPKGVCYPYQENRSNPEVMFMKRLINKCLRYQDYQVKTMLGRSKDTSEKTITGFNSALFKSLYQDMK
jgi:uncharacterized tellurite resistance protein B-like protein